MMVVMRRVFADVAQVRFACRAASWVESLSREPWVGDDCGGGGGGGGALRSVSLRYVNVKTLIHLTVGCSNSSSAT
jgi:hypothetical protein